MVREILSMPPPPADMRLRYGDGEFHFGDLRLPSAGGPHPVVVGIHGGYWRAMYGLEYYGHVCDALRAAGLATWNIEYRRLGNPVVSGWSKEPLTNGSGGWPNTFLDVAQAADHLRALAPKHNFDLTRVVALGHSAGGHLACWLAGRQRIPIGDLLHSKNPLHLKGVVSLAGVLDLRRGWELKLSNNVIEEFLGGTPTTVRARYDVASPYELLPLGVPQILIHGTRDDAVPFEMSERYHAAARAKGDDTTLLTLDGADHFAMVDPRTREWTVVLEATQKLLEA